MQDRAVVFVQHGLRLPAQLFAQFDFVSTRHGEQRFDQWQVFGKRPGDGFTLSD